MKTIIFSFLLLLPHSFLINENQVIWQKVYDTNLSFPDLYKAVIQSGVIVKPDTTGNTITGEAMSFEADYKGAGYKEGFTPIYLARKDIRGFLLVEYKAGQYRVTFKNIIFTQQYSDALTDEGSHSYLEGYALKKGEFTPGFLKSQSEILEYTFLRRFDFKLSDW